MNRREFLKCSGACAGASMAGVPVAGLAAAGQQPPPPPPPLPGQAAPADPRSPQVLRPAYEFVVEIVEGKCQPHPTGQTLKYPEEKGKIMLFWRVGSGRRLPLSDLLKHLLLSVSQQNRPF